MWSERRLQLALDNASLPVGEHAGWLPRLPGLGIGALQLSATHTWADTWHGPRASEAAHTARQLRQAGLRCLGVRVTLDDHPGLGWFADDTARKHTLAYLLQMSAVCRDLGGASLLIGSGRWRRGLAMPQAWRRSVDFLLLLLERMQTHGVLCCLAPLSPQEGDFANLATDCRILADAVDHPALGLAIRSAALADNQEMGRHAVFAAHYGRLELFIADEPGLAPLDHSGQVDHAAMRRHLAAGGYRGWVCLHQRPDANTLLPALEQLGRYYLRQDNLTLLQRQQAG